jgi:hypothetical protein
MRAIFLASLLVGAWSFDDVTPDDLCKQDESHEDGLSLLQVNARKTGESLEEHFDDFEEDFDASGVLCQTGIRGGRYCCAGRCGQCGGRGCQNRPGGGNGCCTNQIRRSGRRCTGPNMEGCMIPQNAGGNANGMGMGKGKGMGMGKGPNPRPEPAVPPLDLNNPELVEELGLCDNSLSFDNVLHSNLGGAGPDSGSADLTYGNVLPGTNLVITATSPYTPNSLNPAGGVMRNGERNGFGVINMASGSSVDLTFRLVDAATGAPKTIDTFAFTLVDGDHGMAHESRESFTVTGFTSYALDRESTLNVENALDDDDSRAAGNGRATFISTLRGSKQDNPESALDLTRLQSRRSVTVLFENKSEFQVTAAERNYANPQGRNIFFTGASNLICPREASCSSYVCPQRMRQRQNAEFTVCASRPCTEADLDTCCVAGNNPRVIDPAR